MSCCYQVMRILLLGFAISFSFVTTASAYEQLSGNEVKALVSGRTFNLRMFHPMDLIFYKNGTFKVAHHASCPGGEKSVYKINKYGQMKIEFRNCNGKKRSEIYFTLHKKNGKYYARDNYNTSYYKFIRKK